MSNRPEKRQRSANFSDEERDRLLDLIENSDKKTVLESKSKDSETLQKKRELWNEIVIGFNATASSNRSEKQLQDLWANIKKTTKKDHSAKRRSCFKTGGGPSESSSTDTISERAANLIGDSTMNPLSDIPDDDDSDEDTENMKSNVTTQQAPVRKNSLRELQTQLIQEKIQQQRELHSAQMDLVATIKSSVQSRMDVGMSSESTSYLHLLNSVDIPPN